MRIHIYMYIKIYITLQAILIIISMKLQSLSILYIINTSYKRYIMVITSLWYVLYNQCLIIVNNKNIIISYSISADDIELWYSKCGSRRLFQYINIYIKYLILSLHFQSLNFGNIHQAKNEFYKKNTSFCYCFVCVLNIVW